MSNAGAFVPSRRAPEVDAVIVGLGLAGCILAAELSKAGLSVVGIERGPFRQPSDSEYQRKHDQLRFQVRQDMIQDAERETWTLRHDHLESALPMRYLGAFCPATGVGGSSAHYGGLTARFAPWEFQLRSQTVSRYGQSMIPKDSTIQDWGLTYQDLEPYYDSFEKGIGVSGKAGNLNGVIQPGGNPFEGARSHEFPLPPHKVPESAAIFADACASLGYHPFPKPVAILPTDYTSPDGVTRGRCTYCGDCQNHLCAVDAKGDAKVAFLPVALRSGRFEIRTNSYVFQVQHDGTRATGVLYHDEYGNVVEQPAATVILAAYTFNNVRLLLLSQMGQPYDPITQLGLVGKNYAYQVVVSGAAFFKERKLKNYMGGGNGISMDDLANDNFDHSDLPFIGGGQLLSSLSGSLINGPSLPPGTPDWGAGWKLAMSSWYDRSVGVIGIGHSLAYGTQYLDLDPTYRDGWGHPLLRITFNWRDNERFIADFLANRIRDILLAMHPDLYSVSGERASPRSTPFGHSTRALPEHFDTATYQCTHNTGGAIMGTDPATSVVNTYLQMWNFKNVWVVGGSAFPQNGTPGPTGTIGALAYRAAEAVARYARG